MRTSLSSSAFTPRSFQTGGASQTLSVSRVADLALLSDIVAVIGPVPDLM